MASHLRKDQVIRTDDIFTNLTIRHGRESLWQVFVYRVVEENMYPEFVMDDEYSEYWEYDEETDEERNKEADEEFETDEETDEDTADDDTVLKSCAEMFVYSEKENNVRGKPKSVLVIGKPGIGKTLLCQKLMRDWASGHLFWTLEEQKKPEFYFAYLLTFRQLNPLKQQEFDLRDIFNLSCVLDEGSIIDEKMFELILRNKENLLVIIDGYDEYSHLDEDCEETYPNDPCTKMPMHAMIAKLLQKKILEGCVLLITSRPHKSEDLEKGKVNFDQLVEIKGFSMRQVTEYVKKYFKADEKMKNVVCDHLRKNASLGRLANVPMLCFLLCYCMEWYITNSKTVENLPVTTADLYSEVIKIFEVKHHSMSQYRKDPIPQHLTVPPVVEDTLSKLSELAALFMKKGKYIFDEDDLRSFGLNKQEVETLQGSGIIHCGPGFRKSPFAGITLEYSFTHLTVQEYLAAVCFVNQGKIPKTEEVTAMVYYFMVQLWSRKKDETTEKLMEKLLISFKPQHFMNIYNLKMSLRFLQQYKDIHFTKRVALDQFQEFCITGKGFRGASPWMISFSRVSNSYCSVISSLLDIFSLINEDHLERALSFPTMELCVTTIPFKISGVQQLCNSLSNKYSPATKLRLSVCKLNNSCIKRISKALPTTNLTELRLGGNKINDTGMSYICQSLIDKECKITALYLGHNDASDIGAQTFCETITHENCKLLTLDLRFNNITNQGVHSLCLALMDNNCKLKELVLINNATTFDPELHMTYCLLKRVKPDVNLKLFSL